METKKKILKTLGLFLFPLILFIVVLFCLPFNKQYAYHFLKNECNEKGAWIHDRIFINPDPVDIAFIGSSRIKASIIEEVLEDSLPHLYSNMLAHDSTRSVFVGNFGYCRWGRNMDYAIIKDIFKRKHPGYIIVELHEEEERLSHIDFAYMADAEDVVMPVPFFNQNIFQDYYHALLIRFDILKHRWLYPADTFKVNNDDHSFPVFGSSEQRASVDELNALKKKKEAGGYVSGPFENWINNRYPLIYLKKIADLARSHHCKLFFLYLPEFGATPIAKNAFDYCKNYGPVWIPPDTLLTNIANYRDAGHFNNSGGLMLSAWLANQLRPYQR
ncbi:MAG: hypothetical protein H0X33_07035 [Taibaiella sp.]|nr:hypothetical protein [Taibaiella sp.]